MDMAHLGTGAVERLSQRIRNGGGTLIAHYHAHARSRRTHFTEEGADLLPVYEHWLPMPRLSFHLVFSHSDRCHGKTVIRVHLVAGLMTQPLRLECLAQRCMHDVENQARDYFSHMKDRVGVSAGLKMEAYLQENEAPEFFGFADGLPRLGFKEIGVEWHAPFARLSDACLYGELAPSKGLIGSVSANTASAVREVLMLYCRLGLNEEHTKTEAQDVA